MAFAVEASGWNVPVPVHVREPAGPPRQAVVMFHHRTGLDRFTEDAADRLCAAGAQVVIPELFAGMPTEMAPDERKAGLHDDAVIGLAWRVVADVRARTGLGPPAAIGFCMGGRLALLAAAGNTGIGKACCFYGGGIDLGWHSRVSPVQRLAAGSCGPVQLHRGHRDSVVTAAAESAAVAAADAAGSALEACVYAGARHAFCNPYDRLRFHPHAADRAWANAMGFLDLGQGGRP